MRFGLILAVMLAFSVQPVYAEDLLDWLEEMGESHETELAEHDGAQLLTLEPGETEMYPRISPDGTHMVVVSGKAHQKKATLRSIENGDQLSLVSDDELALASMRWHGNDQVTFLSDRSGEPGFWQMPVDRNGPVRRIARLAGNYMQPMLLEDGTIITTSMVEINKHQYGQPSHEPERDRVQFVNWSQSGMEPHLLHINEVGAEELLAKGVNAALSPDGNQVVFSMPSGKQWHLYMMNVDGSDLIQLTNDRFADVQPTWSPDGRWIAFTSNRGDQSVTTGNGRNWDIWVIRSDGRSLTRLTTNEANDGAPAIAANGHVYFHSDRKVDRVDRQHHQVPAGTSGFHIWSVDLPD